MATKAQALMSSVAGGGALT
jgi:hypothetical protein